MSNLAVSSPGNFIWPADLYLVQSRFFVNSEPLLREKRHIKAALTKSFNYTDRMKKPFDLKWFGTAFICKPNGEVMEYIFTRDSEIMIAYSKGFVTRNEVLENIQW